MFPVTQTPAQTAPSTLEVHHIPLDSIDQGAQLIRSDQNDDDIIELAGDIAAHGLLQPIGVAPVDGGRYQLLFGARRCLAHRRLGRATIAATFHDAPAGSVRATAARENLLRRQLTLQEEIDVVSDLHHKENRSPDAIASLLSRSRAWVLRRLAVPHLPPDLREPLLDGVLSLGHAEALALLTDDGMRAYALNQTRAATLSVGDTKQMVEALRSNPSIAEAVAAGIDAANNPAPALTLMSPCDSCHQPRPLADLAIVRVCRDGCPADNHQEAKDHAH
jgi:ParB family chromosome partitioning protein